MRRRDFIASTGIAAFGLSAFPARWAWGAGTKKQKVLFFTRSAGFQHSVITRQNGKLGHAERILTDLGKKAGFDVTCSKDGSLFDKDLDQWDAIAFYTTGDLTKPDGQHDTPMSPEGKQRFLDAIAGGKGFIAFHSSTDSFHSPGPGNQNQEHPDPYIAMIGGEFIIHGNQQPSTVIPTSPKFPGTEGLGKSYRTTEEWYALKNFAKDLHVVLVQDTTGMTDACYHRAAYPCTWARMHDKGRVYYTSFGHREDIWTNPKIQELILGGMAWVLGNVQADVTPNIDTVTPKARELAGQPAKRPSRTVAAR